MSDTKTNTEDQVQDEEKQYTPEEIKVMRAKSMAFYKEELPYLRQQKEYETLLAEIEYQKLRRIKSMAEHAYVYTQVMTPDSKVPEPGKTTSEPVTDTTVTDSKPLKAV